MSADRSAAGVGRWAGTVGGRIVRWAGTLSGRVVRVWRVLPHERRLAASASLGLFVTLFLPWYQETVIVPGGKGAASASTSVTGWAAFSFVEAAVLLVAAGVMTLLFQRAEDRAFHLPGGDGWVIMAAGGWACGLVIWRIFDKQTTSIRGPGVSISGIEWGIFVALAGAAFLSYAGTRIRAAHQPEPPLPGEDFGSGPRADREVVRSRPRAGARPPDPGPAAAGPGRAAGDDQRAAPPASRRAGAGQGPSAERPFFERPPGWLSARPQHFGAPEFDEAPTERPARSGESAPPREDPADEAATRRVSRSAEHQPPPYAADPLPAAPLPPATPAARRQQADEQLTIPLEDED